MVRLLLRSGARPTAPVASTDPDMHPLVISMSEYPECKEMVRCLLFAGADCNGVGSTGETFMGCAIRRFCDVAVIRLLLDAGASVNRVTPRIGGTVLGFVCYWDHPDCVGVIKSLLEAGAQTDLLDRDGLCPFLYLLSRDVTTQSEMHTLLESCDLLVKAGCDVCCTNRDGRTALIQAAGLGYTSVVTRLLRAGAEIDAVDDVYGHTALMKAIVTGHRECAMALLRAGADPHAQAYGGSSPCDELMYYREGLLSVQDIWNSWPSRSCFLTN